MKTSLKVDLPILMSNFLSHRLLKRSAVPFYDPRPLEQQLTINGLLLHDPARANTAQHSRTKHGRFCIRARHVAPDLRNILWSHDLPRSPPPSSSCCKGGLTSLTLLLAAQFISASERRSNSGEPGLDGEIDPASSILR